jgi:hypothetical protein
VRFPNGVTASSEFKRPVESVTASERRTRSPMPTLEALPNVSKGVLAKRVQWIHKFDKLESQ